MNNLQSLDCADESIDTSDAVVDLISLKKASHSIC